MPDERNLLLAALLARLADDCRHVVVGANSPIPACAALLAEAKAPDRFMVTILGSQKYMQFTEGGRELFDYAAQGRMDAFFLGGGQIDGQANVNLVGIGDYPNSKLRLPGSYGSAFMAFMVKKVILFREEHSPRVLVPKVDFISAPGSPPDGMFTRGQGPSDLVTGMCHMVFDREKKRFRLASIHPGHTLDDIVAQTGFDFDHDAGVTETPRPTAEERRLLIGPVRDALAGVYPRFVAKTFAETAAA
ncbi:MAG: CoA synthetase [Alphaproteobacteria bacterium]|nr:CoA synthetase [Alphaproteobacteria bacterium]